jgi:type I restriction enzyme M protein
MYLITKGGSLNLAISATVKTIQDVMRKDVGVDGDAQRISQLAWMLFLKILDDREREYEVLDDNYRSPISEGLRWRNWAADANSSTGEQLIEFVNNDLFKTLKSLPVNSKTDSLQVVIRSVFEDAFNYMKSGPLLRQVISKINDEIDFKSAKNRHLFGEIYEHILRNLQSAGNAGEFYTPRALTEFMVAMVNPKLSEKVLDPACGTGGFLTCSIEHIRRRYVQSRMQEKQLQKSIFGIEKKSLPHLLCVTNMLLHGIEVPYLIRHDNTLLRPLESYSSEDSVDVVITNPPFGGLEESDVEVNFPDEFRTKETADLFVILTVYLLKKGGRAAIVLHDGFLKGEGTKNRIKEKLLKECNLHTIVRLPTGVFSPYTNITANILFFDKGQPTKEIWYYEHPLPLGYKSYSKTKPIDIQDFEQERAWWNKREVNEYAWKVSLEEIKENDYNLDFKNPHLASNKLQHPKEVLGKYRQSLNDIEHTCKLVKQELTTSLSSFNGKADNIFFENFSLIASTANGVQRLRELILQLAVEGRLVQQDANDEPASILFERVKKEKERMTHAGIIRYSKSLPPVNLNKVPYLIPETWLWVRLGDIARIIGGGTPKTNKPEYFSDNGIPWLTPADLYHLKGKYISKGKRDISKLGLQKSSARLLPKGAVLFSSRAPIGYVAIAANELATNQGFKSNVPFIMEMNEFIYYFLAYAAKEIDRNASGATFKEVSGKIVQQILFPLPPLDEQQRIVAKVDTLMSLLDALEAKFQPRQVASDELIDSLVHHVAVVRHQHASTS